MGGHGGLNILPQKRWNVYNYENREKVRKDEEAAAREEQLKREQSRKRDAEFRLELLRRARGLSTPIPCSSSDPRPPSPDNPGHINLFQGLEGFSSLADAQPESKSRDGGRGDGKDERSGKRRKTEERPVAVAPEDEKYRMGYGVAGKGVKAPWYTTKPSGLSWEGEEREREEVMREESGQTPTKKKKTIEELREERVRREKREKERARALMASVGRERDRDRSLFGSQKLRRSRFS